MALYTSSWRVTSGDLVFLDFTDLVSGEPRLTVTGKVQDVEPTRAAESTQIPRGMRRSTVSFQRQRRCGSAAAAQQFLLAHTLTLPVCSQTLVLSFQLQGGGQIGATGVLQPITDATTDGEKFQATYNFVLWSVSYTPPTGGAPTPVLGTPAGEVIDQGGGIALDVSGT